MSSESLTVSDLTFEVRRSPRRRTIGITVDRDGELIAHVPEACQPPQVEQVVGTKLFWVYTKLATKALLAWPPRNPEYVLGEGFAYLGRWYRLRYVDSTGDSADEERPLRWFQGRFHLWRDAQATAHLHFRDWYIAHAQPWLAASVAGWNSRVGVEPRGMLVRDLGYRWASCGHSGILHFHWRTILLPPRIIEYVVAHGLMHIHEPHHDAAFWRQLERGMPDYELRKRSHVGRASSI
jgi:predicted metal-dependent hydrolase